MIELEIVTPEKKVVDEPVEMVTVPTASGEIGILTDHAPLISALKPGILSYTTKGVTEKLVISGGFVEVSSNRVSIVADTAEDREGIDIEDAKRVREESNKTLGEWKGSEEDLETELDRLHTATARIELASGR